MKPVSKNQDRRTLFSSWSYSMGSEWDRDRLARVHARATVTSELDVDGAGRRLLDLEELARREVEHAGDDARRELLHLVVIGKDRVVVELARERDPAFSCRQLLLQSEEVLVRL